MSTRPLDALLKAKALLAILGLPFLVLALLSWATDDVSIWGVLLLLTVYLIIGLGGWPRQPIEYLTQRRFSEGAVRSVCLGYASLSIMLLVPAPVSNLGMLVAVGGAILFIAFYFRAFLIIVSGK